MEPQVIGLNYNSFVLLYYNRMIVLFTRVFIHRRNILQYTKYRNLHHSVQTGSDHARFRREAHVPIPE